MGAAASAVVVRHIMAVPASRHRKPKITAMPPGGGPTLIVASAAAGMSAMKEL